MDFSFDVYDMIAYISNHQNSMIELLCQLNNFSKMAGYKVNSNKSEAFLYTNYKWAEKKIRETTPITITTNSIKYLGETFTKHINYLYEKNFKSLWKENEGGLRK